MDLQRAESIILQSAPPQPHTTGTHNCSGRLSLALHGQKHPCHQHSYKGQVGLCHIPINIPDDDKETHASQTASRCSANMMCGRQGNGVSALMNAKECW